MSDFNSIVDRAGTQSLKWDAYAGQDVIPMWVADMDFEAPSCVNEALQERIAHGIFGYTVAPDALAEVIVARYRDLYGWSIDADWLVWLPGVVPGLLAACRALTAPGDEVLTFTPIYPPFLAAPEQSDRRLVTVPLVHREGRFTIDVDAMEAAITPRTRLLLLCHPHNPVGRVFDAAELRTLAMVCREHGIVICSDDIHCDLILDDGPHRPLATVVPEVMDRSLTLMSPGKTFNTAGLNFGFAVIPDRDMRTRYQEACKGVLPEPNLFGLTAALAAYREGEPWRQELLSVLRRNAARVYEAVTSDMSGLSMDRVEATYLAWIDARALGVQSVTRYFREAGVGLSPGSAFGVPGFVRLNFGCPLPLLEQGLARMKAAVAQ